MGLHEPVSSRRSAAFCCRAPLPTLQCCPLPCLQAAKQRRQNRDNLVQRPIFHPSFRNVSVADAVELLDKDDTQTWLLRPSPRGPGQIVLTMQVGSVTSCWYCQQAGLQTGQTRAACSVPSCCSPCPQPEETCAAPWPAGVSRLSSQSASGLPTSLCG